MRFAQSGTTTLNGAYNVPTTEISGSTADFNAPTSLGTLNVSGGTGNFDVNTSPVTVSLSSGTISGSGDMTIGTLFNWTGGILDGPDPSAETILPASSALQMAGTNKFLFHRTLTNNSVAVASWTAGSTYLGYGGIFNNGVGATLNLNGDQDLIWYSGAQPTFNNAGTFAKTGGTADSYIDTTVNNSGSMAANVGVLALYRDGTHTGPFTVADGAALEFRPNGTFTLSSSATVTGAPGSTVRFGQSGTTVLNGAYDVPTTEITGSTADFNAATSLGTLNVSGGTGNFDVNTSPVTVSLSSGTISGSGDMTIGTLFNWTGGILDGPDPSAETILPASSALQMDHRQVADRVAGRVTPADAATDPLAQRPQFVRDGLVVSRSVPVCVRCRVCCRWAMAAGPGRRGVGVEPVTGLGDPALRDHPRHHQPEQDDHDRAADELGQRELPADQQPQHDPELHDQVRGGDHEHHRRGEIRPAREQALRQRGRGVGARGADHPEERRLAQRRRPVITEGVAHLGAGHECLHRTGQPEAQHQGPERLPEHEERLVEPATDATEEIHD